MKVFTFFSCFIILSLLDLSSNTQSFKIINGPEDTTACMNVMAECHCGFTGTDPTLAIPNWRIVFRSADGSIISNDTIDGDDIFNGLIDDLQWVADLTSGDNNGTDSKLLVGPVNMIHNQSSYQCMFTRVGGSVISSVGTMTVVDPLSVIINEEEICATSIIISLNTHSHTSCGDVSHDVTISGNVIYPDIHGDSKYTIDGLQSDTVYDITVTSLHNGSYRILNKSVRTSLPKPPTSINVNSIEIEEISNDTVRVMWKPQEINNCSMLAIKHYDVQIYSDEVEVLSVTTDNTTLSFDHLDNGTKITYTINITVVDINEQRSDASVIIYNRTIGMPDIANMTSPSVDQSDENTGSGGSALTIIIITIIVAVVVIGFIIIIIIILSYARYRHTHKQIDVNSGKKTEDNCYVETQDDNTSHDLASPYAVSGPTPAWSTDSTHSNTKESETIHEPSIDNHHVDESLHNDNIDEDESPPPLQPKVNYAEIQLGKVPKCMKADNHVTYAETKPT